MIHYLSNIIAFLILVLIGLVVLGAILSLVRLNRSHKDADYDDLA